MQNGMSRGPTGCSIRTHMMNSGMAYGGDPYGHGPYLAKASVPLVDPSWWPIVLAGPPDKHHVGGGVAAIDPCSLATVAVSAR